MVKNCNYSIYNSFVMCNLLINITGFGKNRSWHVCPRVKCRGGWKKLSAPLCCFWHYFCRRGEQVLCYSISTRESYRNPKSWLKLWYFETNNFLCFIPVDWSFVAAVCAAKMLLFVRVWVSCSNPKVCLLWATHYLRYPSPSPCKSHYTKNAQVFTLDLLVWRWS